MRRTAKFALLALWMGMAGLSHAQDGGGLGPPDGGDGFGQIFAGNAVRGTVTAQADGKITIRTDEGQSFQVFYSPNTRLVKDRQPIEASDIHAGDMVLAGGLVDAKAKTVGAVFLVDIDPNQIREAKAAFGKTWVAGKVLSIHDLKITIERAGDKQSQTLAVDENTSFRKRREDVTLADVKAGDFITAQGAMKDNMFLVANLRIVNPPAGAKGNGHGPPSNPANPQ